MKLMMSKIRSKKRMKRKTKLTTNSSRHQSILWHNFGAL